MKHENQETINEAMRILDYILKDDLSEIDGQILLIISILM
jgi:hypothetical protein